MLSHAQDVMIVDSVYSPALGATKRYGVILPRDHDATRPTPVLYLLHGHDGSHRDWADRTRIASYVRDLPLIVILPDGDNSWYVRSATDEGKDYETYLLRDLRRKVESTYRIDSTRRAIAGLSMGGYGALLYALKRPDLFRFAGSLSGAFSLVSFIEDTIGQARSVALARTLRRAFGPEPSAHRQRHDVIRLVSTIDTARAPYLYLVTGIQDGFRGFLPAHRLLADSLRARGVRYEYHETPGGHSWKYWGREIRPLIDRMREVMEF
jgi:S-formylglutathione hydrolase FrmB